MIAVFRKWIVLIIFIFLAMGLYLQNPADWKVTLVTSQFEAPGGVILIVSFICGILYLGIVSFIPFQYD